MRRSFVSLSAVLLSFAVALAQDGNWTNKAGHVLSATPVAIKGTQVEFEKGAKTVTYPLAAFLPSEQRRLKDTLGVVEIPDELKDAYALRERTLKRLRLLHDERHLSDESYKAQCAKACKIYQEQADRYQNKRRAAER